MFGAFKCDFKTIFLRHQGERQYRLQNTQQASDPVCRCTGCEQRASSQLTHFQQPLPHLQLLTECIRGSSIFTWVLILAREVDVFILMAEVRAGLSPSCLKSPKDGGGLGGFTCSGGPWQGWAQLSEQPAPHVGRGGGVTVPWPAPPQAPHCTLGSCVKPTGSS